MHINPRKSGDNKKVWTRINRGITCPTVRVKREGEHLGVMPTYQAMDLAYQAGLDLVEIVPNANPPIVEIMDYGKFKFEENKKKKDQVAKSKAIEPKEIRLRPVSQDHDVDTKINQLRKFLEDKHPTTVNIMFKNREMMHKDQGWQIMKKIVSAIEEIGTAVQPPKFEGSKLSVRLVPRSTS